MTKILTHALIDESIYLAPTPAGSYYSVSGTEKSAARQFLQFLLTQTSNLQLSIDDLQQSMSAKKPDKALSLLTNIQKLGWIQGLEQPFETPTGQLEKILPGLLAELSANKRALLADDQGFYLSSSGFPHETAEELSGLSASIGTLHHRYQGVLNTNLGESSGAWGLIDAAGNSQIGFWPIFIGERRFTLAIGGLPQFNRPAFVRLVWTLMIRYGRPVNETEPS